MGKEQHHIWITSTDEASQAFHQVQSFFLFLLLGAVSMSDMCNRKDEYWPEECGILVWKRECIAADESL